jgi:hypothetical protein
VHPARLLLETLRFRGAPPLERLASEWVHADVRGLSRLVALEGCAIWLYRRLRQIGVLEAIQPEFGRWVATSAREEIARNLLIETEAQALAGILQQMAIPSVFLKGVARRLAVDRYPFADARVTGDVDVLVPANRARAVWHGLRLMGYERTNPSGPPRPDHHHLPALWSERGVGVEIHTTNAQGVSPDEAWRRHYLAGMDVEHGGQRFRVPPATELLWSGMAHGLLHPEIAFLLGFLFDAAVIWTSGASLDWSEVRRRLDAGEIVDRTAAAAWLGAAIELGGVEAPPALTGRITPFDLERVLRIRLAVLRHVRLPSALRTSFVWWTSEQARTSL